MKKFFVVLALFVFIAAFNVRAIEIKNTINNESVYNDDDPKKKDAGKQQTTVSVSGQQQKDSTSCAQLKESTCAHKCEVSCSRKENCCSKSKSTQSQVTDEKK